MRKINYEKEVLKNLRTNLSSESLKTVRIRFDFSGVPDISPWVTDLINSELGAPYKDYRVETIKGLGADRESMEVLSGFTGLPVDKLINMPLHVLLNGKFNGFQDEVQFQVSNVSAQLNIRCENYDEITPYLDWTMDIINYLKSYYRTFRLKRFGIRKLDGFMSTDLATINKWIEADMFYSSALDMVEDRYESRYEDNFVIDSPIPMALWSSRLFRVGRSGNQKAYQAIIDIQGNLSVDIFPDFSEKSSKEIAEMACDMNDRLFWLFLHYITEDYIATHKKRK